MIQEMNQPTKNVKEMQILENKNAETVGKADLTTSTARRMSPWN
jgi:hypothetical protein